jgi:hypothetical protein
LIDRLVYVNGSNSSDFADEMRAYDLLQISGLADPVYAGWELREKRCPLRAPERLPMQLAQELTTIFSGSPCRVDAQLESPSGAVSLTEYARGEKPLLLRQAVGPVLISDPWA